MMIRYSKWVPVSEGLGIVIDAASQLKLKPRVQTTARKTKGNEEVLYHAVFVEDTLLKEKLDMTEKELREEDGSAS